MKKIKGVEKIKGSGSLCLNDSSASGFAWLLLFFEQLTVQFGRLHEVECR